MDAVPGGITFGLTDRQVIDSMTDRHISGHTCDVTSPVSTVMVVVV